MRRRIFSLSAFFLLVPTTAAQASITVQHVTGVARSLNRASTAPNSDDLENQSFLSTYDRTAQAPAVDVSDPFFGNFHADSRAVSHATFAGDAQSIELTFSGNPSANVNADANTASGFADALGETGALVSFTIDAPTPFTLSASLSASPAGSINRSAAFIIKQGGGTAIARITDGESRTISGTLEPGTYSVAIDAVAYALMNNVMGSFSQSVSTPGSGTFTLGTPGCPNGEVPSVTAGQVVAEGCFAERKDAQGKGTGVFETDQEAWVGGFDVRPNPGGKFVVDTKTPALSGGVDVLIDGVLTPIRVTDLPINRSDGTLDLNQAGTVAKAILDLPIKGKLKVSWSDGGHSSGVEGEVALKTAFSNFIVAANAKGSEGEFKFKLKQTNKTGLVVNQASAKIDEVSLIPTKLKVPSPLVLHNLTATYDRKNGKPLWSFGGLVAIPLKNHPFDIGGKFFWSEGPAGGGISVDGINKEIPDTPFFLQKLDGDLVFKPDFGVNAAVGVTFGPRVEGKQLAVLEGTFTSGVLVSSSDCPNGLDPAKIEGKLKLAKLDFTDALVKLESTMRTCTYVGPTKGADASGKVTIEFADPSGATEYGYEATESGFIGQTGFNLDGSATLSLPVVPKLSGQALISDQGVAACGRLNVAFQGGFAYRWGLNRPTLFTGCDLSPWRTTGLPAGDRRARTANAETVTVPAGLPVIGFSASSAGGAPHIRVSGPHGQRFTSPRTGAKVNHSVVIIPVAGEKTTYVIVTKPPAGRWTVASVEPSVTLSRVRTADGLPRPKVNAVVTGRGRRRQLRYRIKPIAGQQVTFTERGPGGVLHTLGTKSGGHGLITFTPAIALKRRRTVVAQITQNGLPRAVVTVVHYTASQPPPPGKPKRVTIKRTGPTLRIRWTPVAGASEYAVNVFQGRTRLASTTTAQHAFTFSNLPARGGLTITVAAFSQLGTRGPTRRARTP